MLVLFFTNCLFRKKQAFVFIGNLHLFINFSALFCRGAQQCVSRSNCRFLFKDMLCVRRTAVRLYGKLGRNIETVNLDRKIRLENQDWFVEAHSSASHFCFYWQFVFIHSLIFPPCFVEAHSSASHVPIVDFYMDILCVRRTAVRLYG
ncbi:hypothetical protein CLU81_0277 [Flavobacterium sp. 9]|nr:hypothetical protein CLU81_0277 [Flavobacterium sp. 9]